MAAMPAAGPTARTGKAHCQPATALPANHVHIPSNWETDSTRSARHRPGWSSVNAKSNGGAWYRRGGA